LNNLNLPFLYIALPVIDEFELLPRLLDCIASQKYKQFKIFVCVNQPDEWWEKADCRKICENNQRTIEYLNNLKDINLAIIDKCSPGKGWKGRKHGVGWARKLLMDEINKVADEQDIILSLDADVTFSSDYFQSIAQRFSLYPDAVAMAVPYFHKPVTDPAAYRSILRYEIYMRYYSLNLWRIGSPYTFTALGSAMACPVWAYRAIGGITPKMSGEDFYFLQKLRKYGKMIFWNEEKVYPEARFSNRVYFGTGPAMIKGNKGDWTSYPLFSVSFFDEILETYQLFSSFFTKTQTTRVTEFLREHLKEDDPFQLLRVNAREVNQFVRSCHEKFDGLRVLQYLKFRQNQDPHKDEDSLREYIIRTFGSKDLQMLGIDGSYSLESLSIQKLENIRMFLVKKEEEYQINSIPSIPGQPLPASW
jgi:hypothetical protein